MKDLPTSAVSILPRSVDDLLHTVFLRHSSSPPPGLNTRRLLASLPELNALAILRTVLTSTTPVRNLDGFIRHLVLQDMRPRLADTTPPIKKSRSVTPLSSSPSRVGDGGSEVLRKSGDSSCYAKAGVVISPQLRVLGELEFRKAFLILCYIGRRRLEDVVAEDVICGVKSLPMAVFENAIWNAFGRRCIPSEDRLKVFGRDSESLNTYYCLVHADGTYTFKAQYVRTARTHLQKVLGDDNVLMVRFTDGVSKNYNDSAFCDIFNDGIWVGLRCYRFFGEFFVDTCP